MKMLLKSYNNQAKSMKNQGKLEKDYEWMLDDPIDDLKK